MNPVRTSLKVMLFLALVTLLGSIYLDRYHATYGHRNYENLQYHTTYGHRNYENLHEVALIDPVDHINITNSIDAKRSRKLIIDYLWPEKHSLPSGKYTSVLMSGAGTVFFPEELAGIKQHKAGKVTLLEYIMPGGALTVLYKIQPKNKNDNTIPVLLHQGHRAGLGDGIAEMANALLANGHTTVLMQMPMVSWNRWSGPSSPDCPRSWSRSVFGHNQLFEYRETLPATPMSYFIEPVVAAINYLEKSSSSDSFAMIRLSGGGWTAHIAASIDPRITLSFPVAGSYPLYLRPYFHGSQGDAEQVDPKLYEERASWLDIYLLSALESGRKQYQILNFYDSCCFHGPGGEHYAQALTERLELVGKGDWKLLVDKSHHGHSISPWARQKILHAINQYQGKH